MRSKRKHIPAPAPRKRRKVNPSNYKVPQDARKPKPSNYVSQASRAIQVGRYCDAKLNAERIWLKRKRKDGSDYSIPMIKGDPCPNVATISKRDAHGKSVHRCLEHSQGYLDQKGDLIP